MTVPKGISGTFIDSNIVSAKLTRSRGLERDEYEQMVLGKWSWSSWGESHDAFIIFKEDNSCSFKDLNEETIAAYDGQCRWKILMKSLQLKLTIPTWMMMYGGFIEPNIVSAKLSRSRGLVREFFEEMVLGKWAWSSDGESHDHFIIFNEDNTCKF